MSGAGGGGGGGRREGGACWEQGLGMNELRTTFPFFTFALARSGNWWEGVCQEGGGGGGREGEVHVGSRG